MSELKLPLRRDCPNCLGEMYPNGDEEEEDETDPELWQCFSCLAYWHRDDLERDDIINAHLNSHSYAELAAFEGYLTHSGKHAVYCALCGQCIYSEV